MERNFKKLFVLVFLMSIGVFASASAQQSGPQLWIMWRTNSYVPLWFGGKALPTENSGITASVEVVDGGKLVNLSGQTIYWYTNDQLVAHGTGLQKISFTAPSIAGNTIDLRVEIPSYQSALKTVEIPVVAPEAVIEAPYAGKVFSSPSVTVSGWPFFFNVKNASDLSTSWSVNGAAPENSENPGTLTVNLNQDAPPGANLNIGLTIGRPGSLTSIATKMINLALIK